MSVNEVVHWLVDRVAGDGSVAPEKVDELHAAVDADDAAGQVADEPATPPEPAQPDPEPTPDPAPTVPDPTEAPSVE